VVDGVPRLEELIRITTKPKSPTITLYLRGEYARDEDSADAVLNKLRQTRLEHLTKRSEIIYDPRDQETLVSADAEVLDSYHGFMQTQSCGFDSSWVRKSAAYFQSSKEGLHQPPAK
jgi:hypothetical protein